MRKLFAVSFLSAAALLAFAAAPAQKPKKASPKTLEPLYRQWLEEEVVYIITPKERDVFLQLQSNRERDIFIEAFWKQRDPTPNTPANEFRTEHDRRIKYANEKFGKDSPGPGWQSDQGRIHIMLGEPKTIERYENQSDIYPIHVWFYEGMSEYGLPNAFYVVFFKKYNAGEYILYSPIRDGPQGLLVHYAGDQSDYLAAYRYLADRYNTLADVSMNLIPGEFTTGITPTMTSDILIANRIPKAPMFKVKDSYAEKLLAYKDVIEVDYTANYIDNDFLVWISQDRARTAFVHYLIEPSRLSFERYEDRFLSNLEVDGSLTDDLGRFVYQFERRIPIEMNSRQIASIRDKLFSFQDIFPVIPGRYKLNVIMKNTVSKEFTTIESAVTIPEPKRAWITPLLLANRAEPDSKYTGQVKPFLLAGEQFRPSPRNDFLRTDTLTVFFQLHGLTPELQSSGRLELAFLKEGQRVHSLTRPVAEIPNVGAILETIPLVDFGPSYYSLEATLFDAAGQTVVTEKAQFLITPQAALPRPWVLSIPFASPDSPEITYILGQQRLNRKDLPEAITLLEAAFRRAPREGKYALDLARAYYESKNYRRVKEVVQPFVNEPSESGFLLLMGQSAQALGETAEAVSSYTTYLSRFGTNINVLNSLGDCYMVLGDRRQALFVFEKSLSIEPNQDKIKALVKSLTEKK